MRSTGSRALAIAWLLAASLVSSCTNTGDLAGDVFVTMKSGDIKRGADVELILYRRSPEFEKEWSSASEEFKENLNRAQVDEKVAEREYLRAQADHFDRTMKGISIYYDPEGETAALNAASRRVRNAIDVSAKARAAVPTTIRQGQAVARLLIEKNQVVRVRTDVNGHYALEKLQPGKYFLFGLTRFSTTCFFGMSLAK